MACRQRRSLRRWLLVCQGLKGPRLRRPAFLAAVPTAILFFCLLTAMAAQASVLGLAPEEPPLRHPFQTLSREEVFTQADAIEARIYESHRRDAQSLLELAILNTLTGRPEDRHYALELFAEAWESAPERLDILLWWSKARWKADELRPASAALEAARERFPESAELEYAIGYSHWLDAKRHLDRRALNDCVHAFRNAAQIRPEVLRHARAVTALELIDERFPKGADRLPEIRVGDHVELSTLLLRAAALSTRESTQDAAEQLFLQGIAAMPDSLAFMFLVGDGVVPGGSQGPDGVRDFWRRIDSSPTRTSNERRLEYWRRLLQADLLFGDRETMVPGWRSEPGDCWVRWGRPTATFFQPPDAIVPHAARSRPGGGSGGVAQPLEIAAPGMPRSHLLRTSNDMDPNLSRWHWAWGYGDESFQITFYDANYGANWILSSLGDQVARATRREHPILFPQRAVESDFDLYTEVAAFLRGTESVSLDVAFAVTPRSSAVEEFDVVVAEMPDSVVVEWVLFGEKMARLDEGEFVVRESDARSRFLALLPGSERVSGIQDAWIGRVGLDVPPGLYQIAIEARDPSSGAKRWARSTLDLGRRPVRLPSMSDLRLTASFARYESDMGIPIGYVRHALVTIPIPERRFSAGDSDAFVYFEVYDLGVDESGRTHFDVTYRVERLAVEENTTVASANSDRLVRSEFVEESTARSPDAAVIKGTRLDLGGLEPGRYLLNVEVVDRIKEARSGRSLVFEVIGSSLR